MTQKPPFAYAINQIFLVCFELLFFIMKRKKPPKTRIAVLGLIVAARAVTEFYLTNISG